MNPPPPFETITPKDIAEIAASLLRGRDSKPGLSDVADATSLALHLLDAASFALGGLWTQDVESGESNLDSGLSRWRQRNTAHEINQRFESQMPKWPAGAEDPMPLDDALRRLFEHNDRADDRLKRFRDWLGDALELSTTAAGDKIAKLRKEGVSRRLFEHVALTLQTVMEQRRKSDKSRAGKLGAQKKKAKAAAKKKKVPAK